MKKNHLEQNKSQYFNSFDFLRVFFAISIVAWHTKALGPTGLVEDSFNFNLKDIAYGSLLLAAVPTFAQISLFLYIYNREMKKNYFWKRFFHLTTLYLFWMAMVIILFYAGNLAKLKTTEFWFSGGASPLYFIFIIIILTTLLELWIIIKKFIPQHLFAIFSLFLFIGSVLIITLKTSLISLIDPRFLPLLMSHWSPINFLPYVFSASFFYFIYQKGYLKDKNIKLGVSIFLALIIVIAYLEYRYLPNPIYSQYDGMLIPPYSRLSLILSTLLIFYVFTIKNYTFSNIIKILSEYTLGIYILHIFVMNFLAGFSSKYLSITENNFVYFGLTLSISIFITYLIKQKKII